MTFDPGTLNLEGWWRASWASPWTGTASAGSSGSRSLTVTGSAPSDGPRRNWKTPALFDGAASQFTMPGTLGTYIGSNVFSGWLVMSIASIPGASTFQYIVSSFTGGTSTQFLLYLYNQRFRVFCKDGAASRNTNIDVQLADIAVCTFRSDGTFLECGFNTYPGINGFGDHAPGPTGAGATLTGSAIFGLPDLPGFGLVSCNESIYEFGISKTAISNADFTSIITSYVPAQYTDTVFPASTRGTRLTYPKPYGPGTPAVATDGGGSLRTNPYSGQAQGSRKIDPYTRDYVYDATTGRPQGMTNAQQLVYLAVRTDKGSSAMRSLGQELFKIDRITSNFARRVDGTLRAAVQHIVDAKIISVVGSEVTIVRPGVALVRFRWRDLDTGLEEETFIGG